MEISDLLKARILVVDDQAANVLLLERMLGGAGYVSVTSTQDPRAVVELHREHRYDLILLDLQMPLMDGFEVMEALKEIERDGYLPVLVITAQPDHKLRALRAGAKDFVTKPFDLAEVLTRVHNMLEVRLYARALAQTVAALETSQALIVEKNAELKRLYDQVVAERKVSERLALHVAPGSIAERLQARPDVTSDSFTDVTVLIADVVGWSALSPAPPPAQLTRWLDEIFALFDASSDERGLHKIKTRGNSYMAAAGVPVHAADHAERAARMAVDLLDAMEGWNERNGATLQIRVGLHSGPVVAAVIGRRQYLYDVWGEAVNIASRMESHGVAGRVQISESTRRRLGDGFVLEERGVLDVEGKGEMKTWFLVGRGATG